MFCSTAGGGDHPRTAAILYIKSHHCVQKSMLNVAQAAEVARQHNLPLIVDAAAEEDLQCYYRMGADPLSTAARKRLKADQRAGDRQNAVRRVG